jgi:uncharacterized membrane protein YccC
MGKVRPLAQSLSGLARTMLRRDAEMRLAVRVTVAALLAFALAKLLGFAHGYWAVITAIIVMQGSVGGSLKAAVDRLLGTLAGAIYGAAIAIAMPHADGWELGLALVAAIAPLALLAAIKPNFKAAPITAFIVLVPLSGQSLPPLTFAFDRILEISIGSLVGIVVSLLVLPARAHNLMALSAARIIDLNAELLGQIIDSLLAGAARPSLQAKHAAIRAALKKLETAADEAKNERRSHLTEMPDPEPMVRTLYRVRHDLVMIGRATARALPEVIAPSLRAPLIDLRAALLAFLGGGSAALLQRDHPPALEAAEAALRDFAAAMDALWSNQTIRTLAAEEAGRIFALRFALEQLGQNLRDLANRIAELARPGAGGAT